LTLFSQEREAQKRLLLPVSLLGEKEGALLGRESPSHGGKGETCWEESLPPMVERRNLLGREPPSHGEKREKPAGKRASLPWLREGNLLGREPSYHGGRGRIPRT